MAIERLHHADARHHGASIFLGDQDLAFDRRLPLAEILLGFGQFHDVAGGILKGDELAAAGRGIGSAKGRFQPVAAIRRIARRRRR